MELKIQENLLKVISLDTGKLIVRLSKKSSYFTFLKVDNLLCCRDLTGITIVRNLIEGRKTIPNFYRLLNTGFEIISCRSKTRSTVDSKLGKVKINLCGSHIHVVTRIVITIYDNFTSGNTGETLICTLVQILLLERRKWGISILRSVDKYCISA